MPAAWYARIEFLDALMIRACNRHSKLALAELPTLFLEFHGTGQAVREQTGMVQEGAAANEGVGFRWAIRREERSLLRRARHSACFAALALRPGSSCVIADVCVPMSALAESVAQAHPDIEREGLVAPLLGHVGDGNFHVLFMPMPDRLDEIAAVERVYGAMVTRSIACGGNCTGEHGIGLGKKVKLLAECGLETVDLMRDIKRAWDPKSILNPGKIF